MIFLENEVKLDSLTQSVQLTNYRITKEYGDSYKMSIFLEKISSIEMHYQRKPLLLLLGIVSLIAGVFDMLPWIVQSSAQLLFTIGVILIIVFF